jgi:excisionase family DNA binding protein
VSSLLLKPIEVAELLGLSRSKVFEMLAAEELPVVRFGRVVRVPREQLGEWIASRTRWRADPRGLLGRMQAAEAALGIRG